MRSLSIAPGLRNRLAFWALAGLALFVAHDATFLVQLGPGEALVAALRTSDHGYWAWASVALTTGALVAGIVTALRLHDLRRRAAALGTAATPTGDLAQRSARVWWRLAAVVAIGFAVQENVEHLIVHGHAPGIGALIGPEYPLALPVIGLVSAVTAAVAALLLGSQLALIEAIETALRTVSTRALLALPMPPARLVAVIGSILAKRGAGRAPPALVASLG